MPLKGIDNLSKNNRAYLNSHKYNSIIKTIYYNLQNHHPASNNHLQLYPCIDAYNRYRNVSIACSSDAQNPVSRNLIVAKWGENPFPSIHRLFSENQTPELESDYPRAMMFLLQFLVWILINMFANLLLIFIIIII